MELPTIRAGRTSLSQHEDGSLHAAVRKTAGSGRVVASIVVDAAQLERWLIRQMRAELLPVHLAPESMPGALDEAKVA
jgi:hypothetical protein